MTGSVFNNLMGGSGQLPPEVGMGATVLMWTDRHAATITDVSPNGRTVVIVEDNAVRVDSKGMTDSGQEYEFTPGDPAHAQVFTRRKNGAYVRQGEPMNGGTRLLVGYRKHYYDYSF